MDQLTCSAGVRDHALLIDCHELSITPIKLPNDVKIVVQFIVQRELVASKYSERVNQCAQAEQIIGPLRLASESALQEIADVTVRRRARHVIRENQRVVSFAKALSAGDLKTAGALMIDSHDSLHSDFETSTPQMNSAVAAAVGTPGVFGARMTGGGFGGCIVILADAGSKIDGWQVRAVAGATQLD
jgi:galactokinase